MKDKKKNAIETVDNNESTYPARHVGCMEKLT